jgi:hypothetical protein
VFLSLLIKQVRIDGEMVEISGEVVGWWSGGVVEWWGGGVVEWWNGGVVEIGR